MYVALSRSQKNKIVLILLLMAISIPLLQFNGTLDDFIPKHIAIMEEFSYYGKLIEGEDQVLQVPGFYTLGITITLIGEFAPQNLIFFPIQLIPYAVLFFAVLYRASGNSIVASLITLIELCSGTTGTPKIFFWPHGIGYILFFSTLLLIFLLLKQDQFSKQLIVLTVIVGSSLVYISYNLTAVTLLLLVVITATFAAFHLISLKYNTNSRRQHLSSSKMFFILLLILWVVEFGLSKFVYGVFIPTLQAAQELEMSGLDKFLIAYIDPELSTTPLSPIMVYFPTAISVISGIKYTLLAITIFIFCLVIMKVIIKGKSLDNSNLFVFSILVMQGIYAIPRLTIGGIVVASLWLPGIFCVARFSGMSQKLRLWAFIVISVTLICTSLYYYTMEDSGYIDRDDYRFDSYKAPVRWFLKVNTGSLAVSDELTKDFFILYSLTESINYNTASPDLNSISQQHSVLPAKDVQQLVQLSEGTLDRKYYILNQKLNCMSLDNWIIINSWGHSKERIDGNDQVNKIYDVSLLSIYYP